MPKYRLSPEERAAEKERKDHLRAIMQGLDIKSFDDLKEVFKLMVGENESAKFWLSVLNGLKNRGVKDMAAVPLKAVSGLTRTNETQRR